MKNILTETWSSENGWVGFGVYSWSLGSYEAQWQEMEYADGIYKSIGVISGNVYKVWVFCEEADLSGGSLVKLYLGGNENSFLQVEAFGVMDTELVAGGSGTITIAAFPGGSGTDWLNVRVFYVDESVARPLVGGILAGANLTGRGLL